MNRTRKIAMELWAERYGNMKVIKDFHGYYMAYEGYGDPDYEMKINGKTVKCGWNLHHILPKSKGGTYDKENLACVNILTNRMAADKTTFYIDDRRYQVRKDRVGYDLVELI